MVMQEDAAHAAAFDTSREDIAPAALATCHGTGPMWRHMRGPVWPRVSYNVISGWDPTFRAMINEGWVEPVSLDEMPALKEIPPAFFQRT